jgi:HK97 family phage major capsid protein
MNIHARERRSAELDAEFETKRKQYTAGQITAKAFSDWLDGAIAEQDEIAVARKNSARALRMRAASDASPEQVAAWWASGGGPDTGPRFKKLSPASATQDQWQDLYTAAKSGLSGFRVTLDATTKSGGDWGIQSKAAFGEGAPGSLLPPVLLPHAWNLPYEPDRLFDHFPGLTAESQSVSYLVHTGNTNPAAAVAELGTKPDLGMQISAKTVGFTKVAALCSFSREVLDDFPSFMSFVPSELTRAVVDAETDQIVNGTGVAPNMTGILNTAGTLTRAWNTSGTDTRVDTIVEAANDIRIGAAFGRADLVAMHPTTWDATRRTKNAQGSYVLLPNQANDVGAIHDIFGMEVVTNTKIPVGKAIVLDSKIAIYAWTRLGLELISNQFADSVWGVNAWSFRCEERIAIGVIRPAAVCIVTGL